MAGSNSYSASIASMDFSFQKKKAEEMISGVLSFSFFVCIAR